MPLSRFAAHLAAGLLATGLLAATSAPAQDEDGRSENCNRALAYEDLAGSYTITLGSGVLTSSFGPPVPIPGRDVVQGVLAAIGDSLVLEAPNNDVVFHFVFSEEPGWRWSTENDMAEIDSKDFGIALGCDVNDLPRLVGKGTGQSQEGHPLELTYRLVAPFEDKLYGQFQWQAQGMTMTRSASFEAND